MMVCDTKAELGLVAMSRTPVGTSSVRIISKNMTAIEFEDMTGKYKWSPSTSAFDIPTAKRVKAIIKKDKMYDTM
jgi:hypothetical protein